MYDTYYINIILIICNQPATGNFGQFVMAECLRFAMLRLSAISSPKKHPLFDRWRRTGVAGGASFPCCPRNDGGIGMPCVLVQEWYRIQGTPWGKRNDLPEDFSISVMVSDLVGGIIKDIALLTACLPISCCFWFVMYRCPDPVAQKVGRWFAFKPVEFLSEDRISCGFCFHHPSVPGIAAVRQQRGFMQHTHTTKVLKYVQV